MAIPFNLATTKDIINRVAVEVGLKPSDNPYATEDEAVAQMAVLLDIACEELVLAFPWEVLIRQALFVVEDDTKTVYELPQDFAYLTQQTGWDVSNQRPLQGGLTPQEWAYTLVNQIGQGTLNVKFRLAKGNFEISQGAPIGTVIAFEYSSSAWKAVTSTSTDGQDILLDPTSIPSNSEMYVLFDKTLVSRYLKAKWLEAAGFDTSKAQADFNQLFGFLTSKDKASPVLDQGGSRGGFRYLDSGNLPDTGYGQI